MRYLSLFSGIEAASVAWSPLGWTAEAFAEIDPFPCAVLAHHYPGVENLGDVSGIHPVPGRVDLVVGGSPCQSFSVAGKRLGLDDPRGNLALEYLRIVRESRSRWMVYENVPGLLSSAGGDDFAAFLSAATGWHVECPASGWGNSGTGSARTPDHYGVAWRVLDAQFFGVPQRRRRVFVVGYLGDWRRAAAVLLERHGLSGDPPPRREARSVVTSSLTGSLGRRNGVPDGGERAGQLIAFGGNNPGAIDVATARNAHGGPVGRMDFESETFVAHTLRGDGLDASDVGTGRGTPMVACIHPDAIGRDGTNRVPGPDADGKVRLRDAGLGVIADGTSYTLGATGVPAVAVQPYNIVGLGQNGKNHAYPADVSGCLQHKGLSASGNEAGTLVSVDFRNMATAEVSQTLAAGGHGASPSNTPHVLHPTAFAWQGGGKQTTLGYDPDSGTSPTLAVKQTPAVAFSLTDGGAGNRGISAAMTDVASTVDARAKDGPRRDQGGIAVVQPIAFQERGRDGGPSVESQADLAYSLNAPSGGGRRQEMNIAVRSAVRRLTPVEAERLQGFPDDYTLVTHRGKPAADGNRYKAIGNSMAVPVVRWIGERIAMVDSIVG